jgi:phosphatidylserine/phosphatidylglycerophosphate/cardiolipin synthase-like enzyme
MKRLVLVAMACGLLVQGCLGGPAGSSSPAAQTPSLGLLETPAATPPADHPAGISIPVGYAADGGWYQVFFTNPADSASDQRSGGPDGALVAAIDAAQLTVDAALYSLTLDSARQAFIRAHRRGVVVRLVMESDNLDAADPQAVKDAGIPIIGDRGQGLMHNKFVVIDQAEVWTGSMNLTDAGTYEDRNNLIRVLSPQLAADYEAEFNEMFVDDRFGKQRGKPTPYLHLTISGTPLDVYFSPDDHVQAALLDLLDHARHSIYFMAYSFTSDPLSKAIQQRAKAGVLVSGVMDADQVRLNTGTEYDTLRAAGLDVRLDGERGLMHHKVFIIDDETVVTGSYNFTASAEKYNDENVLVIHNPAIAALYLQEFHRVFAAASH